MADLFLKAAAVVAIGARKPPAAPVWRRRNNTQNAFADHSHSLVRGRERPFSETFWGEVDSRVEVPILKSAFEKSTEHGPSGLEQ